VVEHSITTSSKKSTPPDSARRERASIYHPSEKASQWTASANACVNWASMISSSISQAKPSPVMAVGPSRSSARIRREVIIAETITLKNQAIATSGNYRQFKQSTEGIKSHIINPKTGLPVIRPLSSVTVIAGDCATASSWATALFVMGPDSKSIPSDMIVRWQFAELAELD
jgi:hypothetical protein